jgi:hypothetical protein
MLSKIQDTWGGCGDKASGRTRKTCPLGSSRGERAVHDVLADKDSPEGSQSSVVGLYRKDDDCAVPVCCALCLMRVMNTGRARTTPLIKSGFPEVKDYSQVLSMFFFSMKDP